jgi:hypothetical protein
MSKCFTSVVLLLVFAAGALSGVPLHASEHHCPMAGMADCCEKARSQNRTPEAYAARVCCSLNCSMPGTTGPTGASGSNIPSPAVRSATAPASAFTDYVRLSWGRSPTEHNQHSPPIYIRHLALLI